MTPQQPATDAVQMILLLVIIIVANVGFCCWDYFKSPKPKKIIRNKCGFTPEDIAYLKTIRVGHNNKQFKWEE